MLKKIFGVVLATASVLSFNLPVYADDILYPKPIQSYLNQLTLESDWIREPKTGKHYHFIPSVPNGTLVALSSKICLNFLLGETVSVVKPIIQADSILLFTSDVIDQLGTSGISRFTDVAIKSAVNNRCPQYNSRLPLLNYILPSN